jgi:hypothetical protein
MKQGAVLVLGLCLAYGFFAGSALSQSGVGSGTVVIDARVPGCGDGFVDPGESCDTTNLNGRSCSTEGFNAGTLSCTASCTFNTTACSNVSSGGGGGGGGKSRTKAQVVLTGYAYPKSVVTVLKDAQIVTTATAGADAKFQINVTGLSSGSYNFSVYTKDTQGTRSSKVSFPVSLSKGILAKVDNIFIAPTIRLDKTEVKKGDTLNFSGQTLPDSEVTFKVSSGATSSVKIKADSTGKYTHGLSTAPFNFGTYLITTRALSGRVISSESFAIQFEVGNQTVLTTTPPIQKECPAKADLNNDCLVNLIDFSIVTFWFNKTFTASFTAREKEELNGDGKINLVDLSLVAFYWTG